MPQLVIKIVDRGTNHTNQANEETTLPTTSTKSKTTIKNFLRSRYDKNSKYCIGFFRIFFKEIGMLKNIYSRNMQMNNGLKLLNQ